MATYEKMKVIEVYGSMQVIKNTVQVIGCTIVWP